MLAPTTCHLGKVAGSRTKDGGEIGGGEHRRGGGRTGRCLGAFKEGAEGRKRSQAGGGGGEGATGRQGEHQGVGRRRGAGRGGQLHPRTAEQPGGGASQVPRRDDAARELGRGPLLWVCVSRGKRGARGDPCRRQILPDHRNAGRGQTKVGEKQIRKRKEKSRRQQSWCC